MKSMYVIAMIVVCAKLYECSCEEKLWRGHVILCCKKGTAFRTKGVLTWTKEKPLICGMEMFEAAEDAMSVFSLMFIIVGAIFAYFAIFTTWRRILSTSSF